MNTYRTEHVLASVDENQNIISISFQQFAISENGIEVEGIWEFKPNPPFEGNVDVLVQEIIAKMSVNAALDRAIENRKFQSLNILSMPVSS